MQTLYEHKQLVFWEEKDILFRNLCRDSLVLTLKEALRNLNYSWTFKQVEAPLLMYTKDLNPEYLSNDSAFIFSEDSFCLRPETTLGSYLYADHTLKTTKEKLPFCVWQSGKSFRQEINDGASLSKMRLKEFYQLEFQCIYSEGTKADYREAVENALRIEIAQLLGLLSEHEVRIVKSDRLPSYSKETNDIEAFIGGSWIEICSISTRTDYEFPVLEVALGLDRLVLGKNLGQKSRIDSR